MVQFSWDSNFEKDKNGLIGLIDQIQKPLNCSEAILSGISGILNYSKKWTIFGL